MIVGRRPASQVGDYIRFWYETAHPFDDALYVVQVASRNMPTGDQRVW
jgi:hypothetical protein